MWQTGIAFLAGHCLLHSQANLPASSWAVALAGVFLLALCLRVKWLGVFVLGVAWAWVNASARLANDLPPALEGQDVVVRGYVSSMPDTTDADPQFEFDLADRADGLPARIRLAWYDTDQRPAVGELWQFVVRLKRRNSFANPGGFDYEGYLFRAGLGATGYVRSDARDLRLAEASWRYLTLRVRAWLARRIEQATSDHSQLGVLQGLAVGQTQAMTAEQWRVFAATGTTHLLAISGLHISMVATLLAWCGGCIVWLPAAQRRRLTAVRGKALIGALAAVSYSCLAGLSVPTQRTLIMLCIFFAARWWRRELSVGNALGLSLTGILLLDPFAPLAVGAWLSFVAVAVILLAVGGRLRQQTMLRGFTHVQIAVTIGMAPLVIGVFGNLSLIAPLANAIAVPLFTIVLVPLVLTGTLLAAVSLPAGGIVLGFAAATLSWLWPLMTWFAGRSMAVWYFPALPTFTLALLAIGGLLLVAPAIWPIRTAALLFCIPALLHHAPVPAPGDFELAVLDVGQGLATTVRTHSHVLVYDTGPAFRTNRDVGELVVLPYLRSAGVRRVDMLMVSHSDLDHIGGMNSVLKGIPVGSLLAGPSIPTARLQAARAAHVGTQIDTGHCRRGQHWQWDGVTFEVLHPEGATQISDNESSCVLRVFGHGGSALILGDIEQLAEAVIVAHGLPQSDVVVVAHHGSRSSSTAGLIAATQAKFAIFSAGYRNRWGFPKPDVVARWREAYARPLSTIDGGAITIKVGAKGVEAASEYRREHRHYWAAR